MRIEILVDNEEPIIFPLNKPKVFIGSHEGCDIILEAGGVSRKHISVVTEDDNYFVIDQGSTNGSFINEERLVPGRKVEFTSFFPVRLGGSVLISLLSDEEASGLGFSESLEIPIKKESSTSSSSSSSSSSSLSSDATKTISLKDLQSFKTDTLIKKRQESVVKRKVAAAPSNKTSDKSRMRKVQAFCLVILGAALYWNFYLKTSDEPVLSQIPVKEKVEKKQVTAPAPVVPRFALVDESALISKAKFSELQQGIQCVTDLEKYFCDKIQATTKSAVQVGTTLLVFIDGNEYFNKAKEYIRLLPAPQGEVLPTEKLEKYKKDLLFVTTMLYIFERMPRDLDYKILKDVNLIFALKINVDENIVEFPAIAIVPESLEKLLTSMQSQQFELTKRFGADTLDFLKEYFRYY